jgi:hypothetical protein
VVLELPIKALLGALETTGPMTQVVEVVAQGQSE